MAMTQESQIPRTKHDVAWLITDNGGVNRYAGGRQPGDLNYSAPGYGIVDILDHGTPAAVRLGDGQVVTFGFSVHLTDVGSGNNSYFTLPDICEGRGYWGTVAVSTLDGESDVDAYDLAVTIDGGKFGEDDKTMTFPDAILRGSAEFGASAVYKVTGRCATALAPTVV